MAKRGEKILAGGTWTEAKFFGFIRSALRQASRRWPGMSQAEQANRRKAETPGRHKFEYRCETCERWLPRKQIEMHHRQPVGALKTLDDLPGFVMRLFCEADGFACNCKDCHAQITEATK